MRGGTSTGLVIWEPIAPRDEALREELLRHLMGVPAHGERPGNKQATGLGRGTATSNKVFFADLEQGASGVRLVSTLAQLAPDHGRIDWSVNCGNMSSALQLWAMDTGLVDLPAQGATALEIRNTNTGVLTTSRMTLSPEGPWVQAEIPGVMGRHPAVDLFLHAPAGAKTGRLLPTGQARDVIDGVQVSCVDVAVPMLIIRAQDLGKTAHESLQELSTDTAFLQRLKSLWVEAGLRMQLRRKDGGLMTAEQLALSETIPKVCIVGPARGSADLAVRYFTPQTAHASLAVSGGCCLASATLIPGSVAHELAPKVASATLREFSVNIENPAGVLSTTVVASADSGQITIASAAYQRSAQVLLKGTVPLYNASEPLRQALEAIASA
ncbi:PrpF protein [Roseateles sp. SL47]|uniref:PrpF domain-containing protein n=1 Tax=Roseateles sp. SL47 TaxID=2995138 RepID=UPI002271671D|nr:PrpF domain-containing protein [Roseateles sp. SL47]WAC73389.1 PrpF protein [Roseateles sp. SL47]